jgi:hypothetical protein
MGLMVTRHAEERSAFGVSAGFSRKTALHETIFKYEFVHGQAFH